MKRKWKESFAGGHHWRSSDNWMVMSQGGNYSGPIWANSRLWVAYTPKARELRGKVALRRWGSPEAAMRAINREYPR